MALSANWDLQVDSGVFKILKKIPLHDTKAILAVIKLLPTNPYFGDIQSYFLQNQSFRGSNFGV